MDLRIREASATDSGVIARLLDVLGYPTTIRQVEERLASLDRAAGERVLVAELDGSVSAFASLVYLPLFHLGQRVGRVSAIAVDPRLQRKGLGRSLMGEVEEIIRKQGCSIVEVTSAHHRDQAHRFYIGLGYERSGQKFQRDLGGI